MVKLVDWEVVVFDIFIFCWIELVFKLVMIGWVILKCNLGIYLCLWSNFLMFGRFLVYSVLEFKGGSSFGCLLYWKLV